MIIREANINDTPSIAKVTVDTWKTAYRSIIDNDYLNNLSYEEREKGWRQFPFHIDRNLLFYPSQYITG